MKIKKIIAFFLIGYILAMFWAKWFTKRKDKKKLTLIGIIGGVATAQYHPEWSALFGGLALYETGEEAGISINNPTDDKGNELKGVPFGKIPDDKVMNLAKVEFEGNIMEVTFSSGFYPYDLVEATRTRSKKDPKTGKVEILYKYKGIRRNANIYEYLKEQPLKAKGCYIIFDTKKGEYVYIGMSAKATQDGEGRQRGLYERVYRHFQAEVPDAKGFYDVGADGKNYKVFLVQINNPTKNRLESLERLLHLNFLPTDSQPEAFIDEEDLFSYPGIAPPEDLFDEYPNPVVYENAISDEVPF